MYAGRFESSLQVNPDVGGRRGTVESVGVQTGPTLPTATGTPQSVDPPL